MDHPRNHLKSLLIIVIATVVIVFHFIVLSDNNFHQPKNNNYFRQKTFTPNQSDGLNSTPSFFQDEYTNEEPSITETSPEYDNEEPITGETPPEMPERTKSNRDFSKIEKLQFGNYAKPKEYANPEAQNFPEPPVKTDNRFFTQKKSDNFGKFKCPSFASISTVPLSCPTDPKYRSYYFESSLSSTTPPNHPGPSEQMHAFRDVLIAAIQTRKPLSILPFTKHKKDSLTKNPSVPPGIRVDLPSLCQYVNLKPALSGTVKTVIYMVKGAGYRDGIYNAFRNYVDKYRM